MGYDVLLMIKLLSLDLLITCDCVRILLMYLSVMHYPLASGMFLMSLIRFVILIKLSIIYCDAYTFYVS